MLAKLREFVEEFFKDAEKVAITKKLFMHLAVILFGSYILSALAVSLVLPELIQEVLKKPKSQVQLNVASISSSANLNYRDLKKNVIDRNVFNLEGKYPEVAKKEEESVASDFNLDAPCLASKLQLTLSRQSRYLFSESINCL